MPLLVQEEQNQEEERQKKLEEQRKKLEADQDMAATQFLSLFGDVRCSKKRDFHSLLFFAGRCWMMRKRGRNHKITGGVNQK